MKFGQYLYEALEETNSPPAKIRNRLIASTGFLLVDTVTLAVLADIINKEPTKVVAALGAAVCAVGSSIGLDGIFYSRKATPRTFANAPTIDSFLRSQADDHTPRPSPVDTAVYVDAAGSDSALVADHPLAI